MHPMKYFICILFLAIPLLSQAQLLDFKDVMRLPASVNSNVEESMPLRSPDGKTLYFARTLEPENKGGVYSGSDVWISRWDGSTGRWGKSTNPSEFNTKGNNTVVGVNKDGTTLHLTDAWPRKGPKGHYS